MFSPQKPGLSYPYDAPTGDVALPYFPYADFLGQSLPGGEILRAVTLSGSSLSTLIAQNVKVFTSQDQGWITRGYRVTTGDFWKPLAPGIGGYLVPPCSWYRGNPRGSLTPALGFLQNTGMSRKKQEGQDDSRTGSKR